MDDETRESPAFLERAHAFEARLDAVGLITVQEGAEMVGLPLIVFRVLFAGALAADIVTSTPTMPDRVK